METSSNLEADASVVGPEVRKRCDRRTRRGRFPCRWVAASPWARHQIVALLFAQFALFELLDASSPVPQSRRLRASQASPHGRAGPPCATVMQGVG